MITKIARAIAVAIVVLVLVASPVLALTINNPDAISFYCVGSTPTYKVFYNVLEDDDMLFVAEQFVDYGGVTQNYTAGEAFLFEVLNTAGNVTIASTPLKQYDAKPISIYMDATQVTTANITVGDNLTIRITGNPLIFPTSVNNTVTAVLGAGDYVDQLLGVDGGVATDNPMRNFLIGVADDIETYDTPPAGSEYIITVQGVRYLTTTGGSIFLEGITALDSMCPILFQYSSTPMSGDTPESTGAYASALTPLAKWGQTSANGLTNLGVYLGINQALAGSMMLLILAAGLAIYVYSKTQSGIAVLLLVGTMPYLGSWLGLMPIALAFVFTIVLVVLMGFFFFSRGAL